MDNVLVGKWAFILGLVLAVIVALIPNGVPYSTVILFALGLVVGFLNIKDKEVKTYLVACIALIVVAVGMTGQGIPALEELTQVGETITAILTNLVSFVSASALVVAIKAIYGLSNTP